MKVSREARARPDRDRRGVSMLVAGLLAAGAALRLTGLGARSFWFDEATTVLAAIRFPPYESFPLVEPPTFVLLMRGWLAVAGRITETTARLPSACFSLLCLPLAYALARRWFKPPVPLLALLLLAVSPYQLLYAQEARMYSALACLALAAAACVPAGRESGGASRPAGLFAATAAGGLLHPGFLLLTPALAILILAESPRRIRGAALGALVAGAVPGVFAFAAIRAGIAHVAAHPVEAPLLLVDKLAEAGVLWGAGPLLPRTGRWAGGLAFVAAFAAGLRSVSGPRRLALSALALLPLALLQFVTDAGASQASLRYVIAGQPFFLIGCAAGLASLPIRARTAASAVLLLLNAGSAALYASSVTPDLPFPPSKKPFREVAELLRREARPGDAIVHMTPFSAAPCRLYFPGVPAQPYLLPDPAMPAAMDRWLGGVSTVAAALSGAKRVWLIVAPIQFRDEPAVPAELAPALDRLLGPPTRYAFRGVDVYRARVLAPRAKP